MSTTQTTINGIDTAALQEMAGAVSDDPAKGIVKFNVTSAWQGGTKSATRVESFHLGGEEIPKDFTIDIDEPAELCGANTAPNPQEMLMAAFNACMMVGYVAGASLKGIALEKVEIATAGELDLRGFLGLDASIKPGYDSIQYTVTLKGDGTAEQFQEIHETVMATSPNRFNISQPIHLDAELVVEH